MDRWMSCDFSPFSTVFHSYQNDGGGNKKLCEMQPCLRLKRCPPQGEFELGAARSGCQRLTQRAAGAPI